MKNKIEKLSLVFSIVFFLLCASYTSAISYNYSEKAVVSSCYICAADGCDDAANDQDGATSCEDNCDDNGSCDDCDLTGSSCESVENPGEDN